MVVNGDVLTDGDVSSLYLFSLRCRRPRDHLSEPGRGPLGFGVVPTDDDGRVIAFVEKPPVEEAPTNLINAGDLCDGARGTRPDTPWASSLGRA